MEWDREDNGWYHMILDNPAMAANLNAPAAMANKQGFPTTVYSLPETKEKLASTPYVGRMQVVPRRSAARVLAVAGGDVLGCAVRLDLPLRFSEPQAKAAAIPPPPPPTEPLPPSQGLLGPFMHPYPRAHGPCRPLLGHDRMTHTSPGGLPYSKGVGRGELTRSAPSSACQLLFCSRRASREIGYSYRLQKLQVGPHDAVMACSAPLGSPARGRPPSQPRGRTTNPPHSTSGGFPP